ncbi:hypothetical protein GTQ99_23665, partial [Kineococcus sp. T13]
MTTDLVQGRPRRLPPVEDELLYFREQEWLELFPEPIVRSTVQAQESAPPQRVRTVGDVIAVMAADQGLHRLPVADLPVVVAARMSLSFPVLISAVPLWDVDTSTPEHTAFRAAWQRWLDRRVPPAGSVGAQEVLDAVGAGLPRVQAAKTWVSDGGITSNMPLHFFDAPLPRRPSFAINLRPRRGEREAVTLPTGAQDGLTRNRSGLEDGGPRSLPAFVSAIARTMQNWVDSEQMRMPGYRDRIVSVLL